MSLSLPPPPPFTGETENRRETNRFLGNLQRRSEKASNHTVSRVTLLRATCASGPTDIPAGKKNRSAVNWQLFVPNLHIGINII